jgi:Ala-tRNA(Pro) deacylase
MPATSDDLFARLKALGIAVTTIEHAAAFTIDELHAVAGHLPGVHVKNLFLCDAKKKMWLVVAPGERRIDLKKLAPLMGAARLSFGSADRLLRVLGITPGSVSPFCVINDPSADVQVILDAGMMGDGVINAHPLTNTMTTSIRAADLVRFLEACGHRPRLVDLSAAEPN